MKNTIVIASLVLGILFTAKVAFGQTSTITPTPSNNPTDTPTPTVSATATPSPSVTVTITPTVTPAQRIPSGAPSTGRG